VRKYDLALVAINGLRVRLEGAGVLITQSGWRAGAVRHCRIQRDGWALASTVHAVSQGCFFLVFARWPVLGGACQLPTKVSPDLLMSNFNILHQRCSLFVVIGGMGSLPGGLLAAWPDLGSGVFWRQLICRKSTLSC